MGFILSLIMPSALLLTALLRGAHLSLQRRQQRRCISSIIRVLHNTEPLEQEEFLHLRRQHSAATLGRVFATITATFRGPIVEEALRIGNSCNLSFHAILRRPDHAIVYVSRVKRALSLCEVAHLTATLVANNAPVAYTPLLSSRNRNLQLVGLYIVYHFGFVDAEHLVQQMVGSREPTVATLAIHTLCSICGDMRTRGVIAHFERLSAPRRLALMRHAVQSCYSPQSVAHLLNTQERHEFEGRVSSYKCSILCS